MNKYVGEEVLDQIAKAKVGVGMKLDAINDILDMVRDEKYYKKADAVLFERLDEGYVGDISSSFIFSDSKLGIDFWWKIQDAI